MQETRRCNKCGKVQPLEHYEPARRYRDGRMPICRTCRVVYRAELHRRAKQDPGHAKQCRRCEEHLPLTEFALDRRSPDGYGTRCKRCRAEVRPYCDPREAKDRFLRWKFGISLADYEALYEQQGGVCDVCSNGTTRHLDIDHDHTTGKVRGLLCSACNTALGLLQEDSVRMRLLATYIEEHRE